MKKAYVMALALTVVAVVVAHPGYADTKLVTLKVKGMVCQA